MTEEEYTEAVDSNMGYCKSCEEFTTGCCEPDARGYTCDTCASKTVYGAEEALIMGLISFEE